MDIRLTEADVQYIVESVLRNIDRRLNDPGANGRPQAPGAPGAVAPAPPQDNRGRGAAGQTANPGGSAVTGSACAAGAAAAGAVPAGAAGAPRATAVHVAKPEAAAGDLGVFDRAEDAIEAAYEAQRAYLRQCRMEDRERIIQAIRQVTLDHKEGLARRMREETKLGRAEHKVAKLELTARKTPGTEDLQTLAVSGDAGLTLTEWAPFGVIGAVTPVTNPAETIINNAISMLAAGNTVVFNVHPSARDCSVFTVQMINKAIVKAGGPANLVTMVREPTMASLDVIMKSPRIQLLVGTGGPGMVRTLLASGKRAIGAGAGNPPVVVDETANLANAARAIVQGASFDNNILCIAEKEVFVVDKAADELIFHLLDNGAYMLGHRELEEIMSFALVQERQDAAAGCGEKAGRVWRVAKEWVGQDAQKFLDRIGVKTERPPALLLCEVDFDHPFVQLEQMMPILPIVRVRDLDEAIDMAVRAEHGYRHTAIMHSRNVDHLAAFARAIGTTIFVKNASSLAGVGYGGEGFTTMTIASRTGEGLTSARTFTRQIRNVLAEGGFRDGDR